MVTTIELPFEVKRPILACGADTKAAFALAEGRKVILADGFGDLGDPDDYARYEKAIEEAKRKFNIKPKIIACDLHPDYFSTGYAEYAVHSTQYAVLCRIQHHEAHIASAIADRGIKGEVIGAAFDGTGFGSDGNIWGGEFFTGDARAFKRAGHLDYLKMPGGESAVREPWKMAASLLYRTFGRKFLDLKIALIRKRERRDLNLVKDMIDKNINSPFTSSAGRLFDAVASIVLGKTHASVEAELPIAFEKAADRSYNGGYSFVIVRNKDKEDIILPYGVIKGIIKDMLKGIKPHIISAKFHNTVASMIVEMSKRLRKIYGLRKVVLSGGVFQNRYLTSCAVSGLEKADFEVFTHLCVSPSDIGIPLGQIAIANTRHICV